MTANFWNVLKSASMHNISILAHSSVKSLEYDEMNFSWSVGESMFMGLLEALCLNFSLF